MKKYIDYKVTIWCRLSFNDDIDMTEIIEKLKQNTLPSELSYEFLDSVEYGNLVDTEELMSVQENDGQSTIEVYEGEKMIWDNNFESEIKRKNNSL
jgi:hypothetical protein